MTYATPELTREIESSSRVREWLLCGVLLLATLLNYADRQTLPMTAVKVRSELELTNEEYGTIAGRFGLAFGCGGLLFGILADWISVRWLYPAVMLIWSCAGILTGFADSFAVLWISRMALGLFEAGHWPCALRTTQRIFPPRQRTLANSVLQSGAPVGAILTSVLVLFLVTTEPGTWRQVFWYTGVLGLPWVVLWFLFARPSDFVRPVSQTVESERDGEAPMVEVSLLETWLSRRYLLLVVLILCINTTWHYIRVWLPLALEENLGYTSEEAQQFFILYWISTFLGSMASGGIISRLVRAGWHVHRARLTAFFGFGLLTSLTVVAAFLPAGGLFLGLMLLVGFGSLGLFPIYYSLNQELSARHQGKVGGSLGFLTWSVLFFVHPAIGWLLDHQPEARPFVFASMGLLPLVGWLAIALFWGERPEGDGPVGATLD